VSLTTRLLLYFLGALALVLVGFSLSLWLLARGYLNRQAEERLAAALDTLTAAAEVDAGGMEWEPEERALHVGPGPFNAETEWVVTGARGEILDESSPGAATRLAQFAAGYDSSDGAAATGGPCLVRQRRLPPPGAGEERPGDGGERSGPRSLVVTAGFSVAPLRAALRSLAWILTLLSAAVWLSAFAAGRRVCRRALRPVTAMASAAREMDASDLGRRLPATPGGDELDDLVRAFNGLLDRLAESFERQRRFTGDASHQLRTPLAAMLGQVEVALRRERTGEEYRQALASVRVQAERLRRIVESLLFLARADHESQAPDLEPLDLRRWLADHLARYGDRAIGLRVETGLAECPVETHPALLGELVDTLLDNAIKYSKSGSPVTVRLNQRDGEVVLEVENQGSGIRAEDLPHVFEPFYRADEVRREKTSGVGLGLAVAERVAKALGGRIEAESVFGKWSRFTVRLPLPDVATD
jgi:heavy metal sensor kinase